MTIRSAVVGMTAVCGLAVWAWWPPSAIRAQAQGAEEILVSVDPGTDAGGNHDEAAARFRTNQSRHWKQVALGTRTN